MSVAPYLLLAAVAIFLLEVLERRMGLLSARWLSTIGTWYSRLLPRRPWVHGARTERVRSWTGFLRTRSASEGASKAPAKPPVKPADHGSIVPDEPPAQKESPAGGMLNALTHAQQRARRRTERR